MEDQRKACAEAYMNTEINALGDYSRDTYDEILNSEVKS